MKLNIFRVPSDQWGPLKKKLAEKQLVSTSELEQDGWSGDFLFCTHPPPGNIPWVQDFSSFIGASNYYNRSYFGAMLLEKEDSCYAITFGKSHFFVRPYCDYDFGIELGKRIADERDISQTAARRYQGKQRKDIRSFAEQTRLNVPPGNSVEFLQGKIIPEKSETFGPRAKFGTSALVESDITPEEVGSLLSAIEAEIKVKARFKLPRTLVLSDEEEITRYDEKLIDELMSPVGTSDIATDTFDLFGVDFVFSSSGSFSIKCGHFKAWDVDRLTMKEVKEYIAEKDIPRSRVLSLKVTHRRENDPDFTQSIKEAVDFICDEDRVVLRGGKWLKFNEDYLEALDAAIRRIAVEETEPDLVETKLTEGEFNGSLSHHGYEVADKDFDILKTSGKAPSEAWDLQRDETVYAVKFGTPQKLNYVVDQASSVLELIHNGANLYPIPPFRRYCLWFGYRAKRRPDSLADSGSIILKQKVEAWARQCENVGFMPVIKLSRKMHGEYDSPD
ncbi:DUF6119 family protein [Rhodococcus sp. KRD162]|uniref:DUF6119 family protein n=1 Tax=Rhodococcus sp. KRD162 TaxID=2729725 RepID=UPI0019D25E90|nr:DUF6119 family protein [Rhodococcus sp. KRD162]